MKDEGRRNTVPVLRLYVHTSIIDIVTPYILYIHTPLTDKNNTTFLLYLQAIPSPYSPTGTCRASEYPFTFVYSAHQFLELHDINTSVLRPNPALYYKRYQALNYVITTRVHTYSTQTGVTRPAKTTLTINRPPQ